MAARAAVQREMGLDYLPSTRPLFMPEWLRVLLSGAQGVGKSAALVGDMHKAKLTGRKGTRGVLHETSGIVSLILAPDNVKTDELESDYQANITADSPPAFRLRGRSQKDPVQGGRAMCWIPKAAEKAAKKGANVKKSICGQCPFADQCGSLTTTTRSMPRTHAKRSAVKPCTSFVMLDLRFTIQINLIAR